MRADVSVNPVTNLVTIKLAPPADSSHANPFAGLGIALGKALLQTFGPDLVERELNTRAREQYDLYAMLIPYRVRIAMQQPSAAQIADSGDKRRQQTDDGSKAKREQVEKARRAREAEVAQRKELAAYISKYVTLQDVRVAPAERFGRPELGAFATVVNRGTRTLNKVEVRIYFLDSSGRRIAEKDFPAVFVSQFSSAEQAPLRPHYRKDFGVRLHDAPSGWAQRIEMEVVDIEFADKQR